MRIQIATRKCVSVLVCVLCASVANAQKEGADKLDFASGLSEFADIQKMVPENLKREAMRLLEERKKQVAAITTASQVSARKTLVRDRMIRNLGGFPERTPLNPRVVGVIERDGYRIEKIVFESQPKFYVTANLYIPSKGTPPYPAVLYPLGHEEGGKSYPVWQQMLGSFAKKGYVALTWDPIGQGERIQIYDEDTGDSKVGESTTEHTIQGTQALLIGDNLMRYTIWDGMRALDYLASRKEVDPNRIGCAGNSGGGTHTTYISALDDRIKVAAPSCYTNSWRLMLKTIGPQDAEQNSPPWISEGLDYPDYIYGFAPKPFLVLSAVRDFFPISGARETYSEAKRIYQLMGVPEKLEMVESDDGHGYTKPRRMAAYKWFARWLKGVEDSEPEPEVTIATFRELACTPTAQIATSLGGETVFTLNQKRAAQLKAQRADSGDGLRASVLALTGYEKPSGPVVIRPYGRMERTGYYIQKLTYETEPGIVIPSLLYVPAGRNGKLPAVICVDGRGKASASTDADELVKSGYAVLAIDARDLGEIRALRESRDSWSRYFGDWDTAMTALLIGKSLTGMRAQDISRAIDVLEATPEIDAQRVTVFGRGAGSTAALYASVLDNRIRGLALEDMLVSYESVVNRRIHRGIFEQIVPGALKRFDLPLLAKSLRGTPVWVVNPVDPMGSRMPLEEVRKEYGVSIRVSARKPEDKLMSVYRELFAK